MTQALTLRPYQRDALDAIWRDYQNGQNRLLIQMATGLGKTVCFAETQKHGELAAWIATFASRERRMLVIAHREELITQAANKIRMANPDLMVGIEQGDLVAGPFDDVVVASIQTLAAMDYRRLARLMKYGPFRVTVVDEAHHSAAKTYRDALVHLGFLPPEELGDTADGIPDAARMADILRRWESDGPKDQILLGFTATPNRSDAVGLGCVFQTISYTYPIEQAIKDQWLSPIIPYAFATETRLDEIKVRAGEFDQKQLAEAVNTPERNLQTVLAWERVARGRSTLVFTVDIQHAHDMAAAYRSRGVPAMPISGKTPKDERRRMLAEYSRGRIPVLCNAMLLTEGTDLPITSCIVHAKPTKSATLYEQMCLDAETEILTEHGWAGIDADIDGVKVAAFNLSDGSVYWSDATRIERPRGGEQMWGIDSPHLNIRVTGGHRMVVSTRSDRDWHIRSAEDLPQECRLPVCGIQDVAEEAGITDDDLTFLGLLLTDGSYSSVNQQISLFQSDRYPWVVELIERTLTRIGVKFNHSVNRSESNFGERRPLHRWTISRGAPRSRDKHLRGWGYLSEWISENAKSFTAAYERLSARQVRVLLVAMHAGDGVKQEGVAWEPRSLSICANLRLADQVQSLAVRRGIRCNVSPRTESLVMLHLSFERPWWTVHTSLADNRPTWRVITSVETERVWCVTVDTGAIIMRRRGKVAVVGNTGRGLRLYEGKDDCVVVDMVDITRKHSLQTVSVLVGLPPLDPKGTNILKLKDEWEALKEKYSNIDLESLAMKFGHISIADLEKQLTSQKVDIWAINPLDKAVASELALNWIRVSDSTYRIQYPWGGGHEIVRVEPDMIGHFSVSCTVRATNGTVIRQTTLGAQISDVVSALRMAESFITTQRRTAADLKDKNAWWRKKPASDVQKGILRRRGIPYSASVTKGAASDLIDLANARRAL